MLAQELISAAPRLDTAFYAIAFIAGFIGTPPFELMTNVGLKGGINWNYKLPFPTTSTVGRAANNETVVFRKVRARCRFERMCACKRTCGLKAVCVWVVG